MAGGWRLAASGEAVRGDGGGKDEAEEGLGYPNNGAIFLHGGAIVLQGSG